MSVELAFERLDGAAPERAIAFLHGILGRGQNLKTIARRFIEARPSWTACLIDLRGHGRSPKSTPGPSLEAAARDVLGLASGIRTPLCAIAGHSFGGKVALEMARLGGIETLEHVVPIDSSPGRRTPNDAAGPLEIIKTIEALPPTFSSRSAFVDSLVKAGQPRSIAQWLAQSLDQAGNDVRFALDLSEIRALISDYLGRDLWPVVKSPPGIVRIHLIIADRSDSYPPADREQAERIAKTSERVTVDVLPGGHWIHVDNPDGLLRTLLERIPLSGPS
jgi:pimeloyl-ACP methyl ester carboxylesterase